MGLSPGPASGSTAPGPRPCPDTLRILLATDTHLGYLESDSVRGDDSFNSFEEVLQIAKKYQVDCLLHAGDLFHDNKPTRTTLFRTMELFRKYCLGEEPSFLEHLSDPAANYSTNSFGTANYLDPNFNVSLPVFAIHGNHDDPTGDGNLCALDLLSVSGLINYFGKVDQVNQFSVKPVRLRKGNVDLNIFGIGNIRDERLHHTFLQEGVKFEDLRHDRCFNMLMLHQNRVQHTGALAQNFIPEEFLSRYGFHLTFWGHEHECRIIPQSGTPLPVSQPGSSVATALCKGEAVRNRFDQYRRDPDGFREGTVTPLALAESLESAEQAAVFDRPVVSDLHPLGRAALLPGDAGAPEVGFGSVPPRAVVAGSRPRKGRASPGPSRAASAAPPSKASATGGPARRPPARRSAVRPASESELESDVDIMSEEDLEDYVPRSTGRRRARATTAATAGAGTGTGTGTAAAPAAPPPAKQARLAPAIKSEPGAQAHSPGALPTQQDTLSAPFSQPSFLGAAAPAHVGRLTSLLARPGATPGATPAAVAPGGRPVGADSEDDIPDAFYRTARSSGAPPTFSSAAGLDSLPAADGFDPSSISQLLSSEPPLSQLEDFLSSD
ncbi:double-strand break repair protein MRE11 [Fonticula alba]|uniref:Double-strand break repair protein MRE11 n=1 Tax=Fonticula alba TaxID=691883 RepID=A0A058ZF23_FONAL|nr:double-strand break repair protein MRE11 [Fonticula alba]KCV72954.1 double-strand break repair protein MRE11 [Fonticula alba]|eukprot:XP_009492655.1 double-strand break repair protein MRE11 [Fonticula alba]